jgi:hypothetical protein
MPFVLDHFPVAPAIVERRRTQPLLDGLPAHLRDLRLALVRCGLDAAESAVASRASLDLPGLRRGLDALDRLGLLPMPGRPARDAVAARADALRDAAAEGLPPRGCHYGGPAPAVGRPAWQGNYDVEAGTADGRAIPPSFGGFRATAQDDLEPAPSPKAVCDRMRAEYRLGRNFLINRQAMASNRLAIEPTAAKGGAA